MQDRIEIYLQRGLRRKWRWRYVAANGNIMADSGQGYVDKRDALAGALAVTGTWQPTGEYWYALSEGNGRRLHITELD